MKKIFKNIFFAVLLLIVSSLSAYDDTKQFYISEVVESVTEQLKSKLHFRHGLGSISNHHTEKIEGLDFQFYIPRRATVEEARALLLVALDRCTQTINSHEKIQPFLISNPFSKERVHITLYFEKQHEDEHVSSYYDGSVTTAFGGPDSFSYIGQTPFTSSINLGEETFKEATILAAKSPIKDLSVHHSTETEERLDIIFDQFSKEMEAKFDLWLTIGGAGRDVEIDAKMRHRATQKEARKVVVLIAEELSDLINSHFNDYDFHPRRLKMKIDFIDWHHRHYYDGTMESVMLDGSEISYLTSEKDASKRELPKESYREALEIVQTSPPDTLLERSCKALRNFWDGLVYSFKCLWMGFWFLVAFLLGWVK